MSTRMSCCCISLMTTPQPSCWPSLPAPTRCRRRQQWQGSRVCPPLQRFVQHSLPQPLTVRHGLSPPLEKATERFRCLKQGGLFAERSVIGVYGLDVRGKGASRPDGDEVGQNDTDRVNSCHPDAKNSIAAIHAPSPPLP